MEISLDDVRTKTKLFVCTPMYGGQCAGMFTKSIVDLASICTAHGIDMRLFFLFNESLITRARNYCVDEFLRSECTHLMFIDSDIGFDPRDVIALLGLSAMEDKEYDIIGAVYPKKCIAWEKVKVAVDQGRADQNPNILDQYIGDFVFNPVPTPDGRIPLGEPAEVLEIGTGFMMIRRETFAKYKAGIPNISYLPDHTRSEHFDGSREIEMYFQAEIDPASRRYLSEDYLFCQNIRKVGGKVWMCPWMELKHIGSYIFGGSLRAIAEIGTSATADHASKPKK